MAWQQLTLAIFDHEAETLEDWLLAQGALSVTLQDAGDQPVFEPALGTTPLWDNTLLVALFEESVDLGAIASHLPITRKVVHTSERLEDKVWEREWMMDFHPMKFGQNLWICPSTESPPEPDAITIILDPGLAFGTGTHPTTALCLEWIDSADLTGKTVLDFGCGSGVLAIAALLSGASHAWCVDIDEQALLATADNATRNHIDLSCITLLKPEQITESLAVDITLANILAPPLLSMADDIVSHTRIDGSIVLSGILDTQADDIVAAYKTSVDLNPVTYKSEWVRVDGIRRH